MTISFLGAVIALLPFLLWGGDYSVSGTAIAAPLEPVPLAEGAADLSVAVESMDTKSAASDIPDGWVVECVDCPNTASVNGSGIVRTSTVVDSQGYPHVAFFSDPDDDGTGALYYGFLDGTGWHSEQVDHDLGVGEASISLALDQNENPHVAYLLDPNDDQWGNLYYGFLGASGWYTEEVRHGMGVWESSVSLALDQDGNPHLGYASHYDDGVWYAYQDPGGGGWQFESVDSAGFYPSLTLDSDGNPHMSYQNMATTLTYAYRDAGGWQTEPLVEFDYFGAFHTSIALDGNGRPHIGCNAGMAGAYDLWYAGYDGSIWYTNTVDTAMGWHSRLSLDVDTTNDVHIAYRHADEQDLRYAHLDSFGWHTETIDSQGTVGFHPSLGLDSSGYSHVFYIDATNDELKYAYQDASGWHIQQALGLHTSLALDENGYAHISYYDRANGALKYAYRGAAEWYSQTVDSSADVGLYTSLALDRDGYPHISYYDVTNEDLKYAYQDASGWHSQTVDSDGSVGGYTSLALASTAPYTPHISYYDATNERLKYAYLGVAGWHSQTVGTGFPAGQYTSLVLDDDGYPHISYYCHYFGDLRYTRQSSTGWSGSVVAYYSEDWNKVGMFNSLALDSNGDPWISYYDAFLGALRVATGWAPTGWTTMVTVDSGYVWDTSLVMHGTYPPYPHISYYDALRGTLKYAFKDASGWHSQAVDYEGDVGRYTSLALDANGHPHISYYDAYQRGLKHAYFSTKPIAAFTVNPTTGIAPLTVAFTDTSTGGEADTWLWSFGDDVTSTLQNPNHTYTAAGTYTVTLAVSGPGGSDAISYANYITVYTPVAAAFTAAPTSGPIPLEVTFTNASSGDYTDSLWEFGDGLTSTLESPTHTYTAAGTYTVTLTVNGPGGTAAISQTHYITGYTPVEAAFTAAPTSGFAPLTVTFTNTSSGDYTTSLWEFGDGLTSTLESPTHTYTTIGTHGVTLTVSGPGGTDTLTRTDYITVYEAVRADFTASPVQGVVPLVVTFTDTSSGPVTVWQWDFGDGAMSTLQHPTHTYTTTGVYTVALTAQVAGASAMLPGGTDTLKRRHYITVSEAPPQVDFVGNPRSGDAPLTVHFTSTVTGTVTDYQWNFGHGGVADTPNPTHTYPHAGSFGVTLVVTGPGGTADISKPGYIAVNAAPGAPTATFTADVTSGTVPLTVTFTAVTSGTVEHWLWSFGDDSTAFTGPVVSHTYVTSDTFDVSLTVSNTHGSFIVSTPAYITVRTKDDDSHFIYLPLILRNAP